MNKKINLLVGTCFLVGFLEFTPLSVKAVEYKNVISLTGPSEAIFKKKADQTHYKYYTTKHNSTNKLFKKTIDGYSFWSPVRPKSASGGISTNEYFLENVQTAHQFSGGDFRDLWLPYPSITRNFKNAQMKLGTDDKNINRAQMVKKGDGYAVEDSPFVNHGGSKKLKNKSGQWRYDGYTTGGEAISNPRFPIDYPQSNIKNGGWVKLKNRKAHHFNTTIYDTKDYKTAKKNLIKRLMKEYPSMKRLHNADTWMEILSLQTEPEKNPFNDNKRDGKYGGANFFGYTNGGTMYRGITLYDGKNTGYQNLNLSAISVYDDSGKRLKMIKRSKAESRETTVTTYSKYVMAGSTITVKASVKNLSKLKTRYTPTTVNIGVAKNYQASSERVDSDGWWYNPSLDSTSSKAKYEDNTPIAAKGSQTVTGTVKIPDNAQPGSTVRVGAVINDNHRKKGDNLNETDDDLILTFKVATGNVAAKNVELIDAETGKVETKPIPGHKYKIRYHFTYSGPTVYEYSNTDPSYPIGIKSTKTYITYNIVRKLPDGSTETISKTVTKNITLQNGSKYYVDSTSEWYEWPTISTTGSLSIGNAGFNNSSKDDTWNASWSPEYDYTIENLQVLPRTEYYNTTASDGKQHYTVSFNVVNDTPKNAVEVKYGQEVKISLQLGGQIKTITEYIAAGENKNIVVDFALDPPKSVPQVLNAEVVVNSDGLAYENGEDVMENNKVTTKVNKSNIYENHMGAEVNPYDSVSNTGAYLIAPVSPENILLEEEDNTSNSWDRIYETKSWSATQISYKALNRSRSFYRYKTESVTNSSPVTQSESYTIKDVLFKSKITTDNGWGENHDGWVSLVNTPYLAQVKAGYGYQLKLLVEYSTDAFDNEPTSERNASNPSQISGKTVRPHNAIPNIARDIYFQTSDGKIISASGIDETNALFKRTDITSTKNQVTMEYTLKDTTTMGIKTPGRIYISEKTPDGMYSVRAWTPVINGVPTKEQEIDGDDIWYPVSNLWDVVGDEVSSKPESIPTKGTDPDGNPIIDDSKIPPMHIIVIGSDKDDLITSVVQ